MANLATYRNERPYDFCPGCSHGLILEALNRALVRMQWDPADVVIVTDIGCVGLSDQYFITSGFHGLHGRSLTYATGIKLARPELHVIVLIGDGGCGIGGTHLINAARRNIGVTTLVFNNLNFGMTGGEHSVTTPWHQKTVTTPWGNPETPLDIAATAAVNGATYVWRGTAYEPDLDQQIVTALSHDGFALLDIWELCVAHYATTNKMSPQGLVSTMTALGFQKGIVQVQSRTEGARALREAAAPIIIEHAAARQPVPVPFRTHLDRSVSVVIAGAAGSHVRTTGHLVCTAATMSDLWTTQRDDYPITVRSGYSLSELLLSPDPIIYTGVDQADVLFILAEEGWTKARSRLVTMTEDGWVFMMAPLVETFGGDLQTAARVRLLNVTLKGVARSCLALAAVAAGMVHTRLLKPEALLAAATALNPAYAQMNSDAVRTVLDALEIVVTPYS